MGFKISRGSVDLRIAIVDDNLPDAQLLYRFAQRYCRENRVEYELDTVSGGEAFFKRFYVGKYDVVLLDISMHGMDGMAVAEKIRETDDGVLIIFTTTSSSYAVKSYRVRAFDYLVKPFDYEQFCQTMQLCAETLSNKQYYIEIKEGRVIRKVRVDDIVYTDYSNHYIYIHTSSEIIKSYLSFADFSPMLLPFPQFLCCYRNCIVNLDHVLVLKDRDFEMADGTHIPIKKEWYKGIRQKYTDYIFEGIERGGRA